MPLLLSIYVDIQINAGISDLAKYHFILVLCLFGLAFGPIFANLFPDLATDEQGLYVKFYFKWLFVPWEDVTSFRISFVTMVAPASRKHRFLLVKKGLTPVHWLISLNQLGGWGPGFLVSERIPDYPILKRTINDHIDIS